MSTGSGNFSKRERRIVLFFAFVAVMALCSLLVVDIYFSTHTKSTSAQNGTMPASFSGGQSGERRVFDPNTVDSLTLSAFDISPRKIRNLIHYREAGKRFDSVESMLDTYGWDESDIRKIEDYVVIADKYRKHGRANKEYHGSYRKSEYDYGREYAGRDGGDSIRERKYVSSKFRTLTKVDPNIADSATLCSIPGVGSGIVKSIIGYRKKLGGFASVSQLSEIKIISPELLEWFEISNPSAVQKININKDSFQRLNSHPYISYDQTRDMLRYRRIYGEVKDAGQLLSTGIFTAEEIERLKPYIVF